MPFNVSLGVTRSHWTTGVDPIGGAGNIYANLLEAFLPVLHPISLEQLSAAREGCRLIARAIVCADRVIDSDVAGLAQVDAVLASQVCLLEGVRELLALIGTSEGFWAAVSTRLCEFAAACRAEAAARGAAPTDLAAADAIALGKNALARMMAQLACMLGGRPELVDAFDRVILDLTIAVQVLDDAVDWRTDLASGRISLVTVRVWRELGGDGDAAAVQRYVYGAVIPALLERGRAALEAAVTEPALAESGPWREITGRIRERYDAALALFAGRNAGTSAERRSGSALPASAR